MSRARGHRSTAIFCDSATALRAAASEEIGKGAGVLTISPFLHHDGAFASEFLPDRVSNATSLALQAARIGVQNDIQARLGRDKDISRFAQPAAMSAMRSISLAGLAACLEPADICEPRIVITSRTGSDIADTVVNGPWERFLAGNPHLELRSSPVPLSRTYNPRGGAPPGLADRLRLSSWRRLVYRAAMTAPWLMPARASRYVAWIAEENELVQEIATGLMAHGVAIRCLPATLFREAPLAGAEHAALSRIVGDILQIHIAPLVPLEPVRLPLITLATEYVLAACAKYEGARKVAEHAAEGLGVSDRAFIVSNFPARPGIAGVADAWRQRGVPLFGIQHGVTYEICEGHGSTYTTYENAVSDRSYVYNQAAKSALDAIENRRGDCVVAGMPADLRRTVKAGRRPAKGPICFVSTAAYHSYSGKFQYGTQNDGGMLNDEIEILEALGSAPHPVLYKTYPALRFLDADPAQAFASGLGNVEIYDGDTDLRYLLKRCRLLVTARATSTVSWCIMSGLPVVFIDMNGSMPLNKSAREAFEAGLFVHGTERPGWAAALADFLRRPLADIEQEWDQKAPARRDLVARFMGAEGSGGPQAARDILRFMRRADRSRTSTRLAHDP